MRIENQLHLPSEICFTCLILKSLSFHCIIVSNFNLYSTWLRILSTEKIKDKFYSLFFTTLQILIDEVNFSFSLSLSLSIYIYIYIYRYKIFTNLLSTSITGYQEKKKKTRREQEIKISRITVRGEKRKNIMGQKKNRPSPSHQLIKRKIKPSVKCRNATITRVLNTSGANYKINLNRVSDISY